MSRKSIDNKKWIIGNILCIIIPILVTLIVASFNGTERSYLTREWGVVFLCIIFLCVVASFLSLFRLQGLRKLVGLTGLFISLSLGYLVWFSYSLSFYGL